MTLVAKTLEEINPPKRQKAKATVTLSNEEQQLIDGDAAFLDALVNNDQAGAKAMLDKGQMINVADENGLSTMQAAIKGITSAHIAANTIPGNSDLEFLGMLVQKGIFVDYKDAYGKRPVNACIEASEQGAPLLKFILDLNDKGGTRVVELLESRERDGHSLLHDVAWAGNTECCKLLLDTNVYSKEDLNKENKQGQGPLHVAAFRSPKSLVELLTKNGADHQQVERNPRRLSKETPDVIASGARARPPAPARARPRPPRPMDATREAAVERLGARRLTACCAMANACSQRWGETTRPTTSRAST